MKKLFFALSLCAFFALPSFAQTIQQDLEKEMEIMQNELKTIFQDAEIFLGTMPTSIDSIDFQQFGLGDIKGADIEELLQNFMPQGSDVDLDQMMQQFQKEMQSLDLKEFETIFKEFGLDQPAIPAPDRLKDSKSTKPTEKKTERKKYSM